MFDIWGIPVPTPFYWWWSNLVCQRRAKVYTYTPNFIWMCSLCRLPVAKNHNFWQMLTFGGSCTDTIVHFKYYLVRIFIALLQRTTTQWDHTLLVEYFSVSTSQINVILFGALWFYFLRHTNTLTYLLIYILYFVQQWLHSCWNIFHYLQNCKTSRIANYFYDQAGIQNNYTVQF